MLEKRYQYYSKEGIVWTKWFRCATQSKGTTIEKFQSRKLLNEYREV